MENRKFIITINREAGTGGREIAQKVSEMLGIKLYDRTFLAHILEEFKLTWEEAEKIKSTKINWWSEFCRFYKQFGTTAAIAYENFEVNSKQLYYAEAKALRDLAEQESCVIVGRTGFHVFKDTPDTIRIFLIADMDHRVKRMMQKRNFDEKEAREKIEELDNARETFTKTFAGVSRYDARNYDLVLNVGDMTDDEAVAIILKYLRFNNK